MFVGYISSQNQHHVMLSLKLSVSFFVDVFMFLLKKKIEVNVKLIRGIYTHIHTHVHKMLSSPAPGETVCRHIGRPFNSLLHNINRSQQEQSTFSV